MVNDQTSLHFPILGLDIFSIPLFKYVWKFCVSCTKNASSCPPAKVIHQSAFVCSFSLCFSLVHAYSSYLSAWAKIRRWEQRKARVRLSYRQLWSQMLFVLICAYLVILMICRYPYVTGTSVLGIKYKDGVLIAADTAGPYLTSIF